jgi:hypothetical protein
MDYVNLSLREIDFVEGVDYGQMLKVRRQQMSKYKGGSSTSGINWFGTNNNR